MLTTYPCVLTGSDKIRILGMHLTFFPMMECVLRVEELLFRDLWKGLKNSGLTVKLLTTLAFFPFFLVHSDSLVERLK